MNSLPQQGQSAGKSGRSTLIKLNGTPHVAALLRALQIAIVIRDRADWRANCKFCRYLSRRSSSIFSSRHFAAQSLHHAFRPSGARARRLNAVSNFSSPHLEHRFLFTSSSIVENHTHCRVHSRANFKKSATSHSDHHVTLTNNEGRVSR